MKLFRHGPPGSERPGMVDAHGALRDLTTGEQISGQGQPVRLCVTAALSDLQLESMN